MELPDNTTWYSDGAIPGLPAEAGCPYALEAVLRGLLQSRPEDRLPPEEAIEALLASLYGPGRATTPTPTPRLTPTAPYPGAHHSLVTTWVSGEEDDGEESEGSNKPDLLEDEG